MQQQETDFKGFKLSGFVMIFAELILIIAAIFSFMNAGETGAIWLFPAFAFVLLFVVIMFGFMLINPNNARVMIFFGKYRGTLKDNGFFWVNPFYNKKEITLRARNIDLEPIKVNDKVGNPIMIGMVLVWKVEDTYKSVFDIDVNVIAGSAGQMGQRMRVYENFVKVQGDAALRKVAGLYPYDSQDAENEPLTLRSGGEEINEVLEHELSERLAISGIKIIEARINYLAYAAEIAGVMLRRQQAHAIIAARTKIVEGAVGMVELALEKLSKSNMVELDDDKKAAMVSNLMVVLCANESVQPVVNTGTLNQ
jgi:regulator of protease activity HflC (stomatin/prohibitin superfamily)